VRHFVTVFLREIILSFTRLHFGSRPPESDESAEGPSARKRLHNAFIHSIHTMRCALSLVNMNLIAVREPLNSYKHVKHRAVCGKDTPPVPSVYCQNLTGG
jgi:hypothetical protein